MRKLLSSGVNKDHTDLSEYRTYLVFRYTILIGIVVHALLGVTFLFAQKPSLAVFNLGSVAAWVGARALNQRGRYTSSLLVMAAEVALHSTLMVTVMGWSGGFQYYLVPGIPFILFNIYLKDRFALLLASGLSLLFTGLYGLSTLTTPAPFDPSLVTAMHYTNTVVCAASLIVISYFFRLATTLNDERLREVAHTDFLTGLRNRRSMIDLLEQQRLLSAREGSCFGVLLIDLDHFKTFNDRFGHACGDYVLTETARVMRSSVRGSDVVARWGGEEFLVMTPSTGPNGAVVVAEDLRRAIESQPLHFAGQVLNVTATVGVATSSGRERIKETLKHADRALYRGKELGRNRVHQGEVLEV